MAADATMSGDGRPERSHAIAACALRRTAGFATATALTVTLAAGCGSGSSSLPGSATAATTTASTSRDVLVGAWTVVAVTTTDGTPVPLAPLTATVRFRSGQVALDDGVNHATAA